MSAPLRLELDGAALVANWRRLAALAPGAACGAAIKADGYGLGARGVADRLFAAGCRDFFVATWDEAERLGSLPEGASLSVLHGVRAEDMSVARSLEARPVLNSVEQVRRWRDAGGGACDVMVDTGINRLGLTVEQVVAGVLDGLVIETLMSHLACADEPGHPLNARQREAFAAVAAKVAANRLSLANSAGVLLGPDFAFDLTRPGLGLYGGAPAVGGEALRPVVRVGAQILQVRTVEAGGSVGYGATWTATASSRIAIANLGYADGFFRALGRDAAVRLGDIVLPVAGRVSMDLLAIDATGVEVAEGDWVAIDYDLPQMAASSGLTQYELLTSLGARFERVWR